MHDWLEAVDQPVWEIAVETYRFTKPNLDMQQKFCVIIEAELNSRMWRYPYISFHFISFYYYTGTPLSHNRLPSREPIYIGRPLSEEDNSPSFVRTIQKLEHPQSPHPPQEMDNESRLQMPLLPATTTTIPHCAMHVLLAWPTNIWQCVTPGDDQAWKSRDVPWSRRSMSGIKSRLLGA